MLPKVGLRVGKFKPHHSEVAECGTYAGKFKEITWMRVLGFPGVFLGTEDVKTICNHIINYDIRVLLVYAVPMIYICCIKYVGKWQICVLVVRDDELDVSHDEATSFGCCRRRDTGGKAQAASIGGCRRRGEVTRWAQRGGKHVRGPGPEFRMMGREGYCWVREMPGTPCRS
jgi:hypothetical protein